MNDCCPVRDWVTGKPTLATGSNRCIAGLRFSPLLTFNFLAGPLKTALDRHICAPFNRHQLSAREVFLIQAKAQLLEPAPRQSNVLIVARTIEVRPTGV